MKILSVSGESVPASKGNSPSDTFERSIVTYENHAGINTKTVTYVRYFEKVLSERGIYDQEKEGVPVNKLAAVLFIDKYPNYREARQYYNDTEEFLKLFEGFSLASFQNKYSSLALA